MKTDKIRIAAAGAVVALVTSLATVQAGTNGVTADFFQAVDTANTNYFLGKTGVGTNVPAAQLHVVGNVRVDGPFQVAKGGDVSMGAYTNGVSDQGIVSTNLALHGGWVSYDGSASGVYVSSGGNVGVGTASPGAALDVAGDVRVTGTIYGTVTNSSLLGGLGSAKFARSEYVSPFVCGGYNGTTLGGDPIGGIFWVVAYADTDASFQATFFIATTGSYQFRLLCATDAANTAGKVMSGKITAWKYDTTAAYGSLVTAANWDLPIPTAQWGWWQNQYGTSYTLNAGDTVLVTWQKDNNSGGAVGNCRFEGWSLVKQ